MADRLAPGRIVVSDACDGLWALYGDCTSNVLVHEEVRLVRHGGRPRLHEVSRLRQCLPDEALSFGFRQAAGPHCTRPPAVTTSRGPRRCARRGLPGDHARLSWTL